MNVLCISHSFKGDIYPSISCAREFLKQGHSENFAYFTESHSPDPILSLLGLPSRLL
jgi:hypothetical protein